jgi:hypothetical protein
VLFSQIVRARLSKRTKLIDTSIVCLNITVDWEHSESVKRDVAGYGTYADARRMEEDRLGIDHEWEALALWFCIACCRTAEK